jgi:hypothetical protein
MIERFSCSPIITGSSRVDSRETASLFPPPKSFFAYGTNVESFFPRVPLESGNKAGKIPLKFAVSAYPTPELLTRRSSLLFVLEAHSLSRPPHRRPHFLPIATTNNKLQNSLVSRHISLEIRSLFFHRSAVRWAGEEARARRRNPPRKQGERRTKTTKKRNYHLLLRPRSCLNNELEGSPPFFVSRMFSFRLATFSFAFICAPLNASGEIDFDNIARRRADKVVLPSPPPPPLIAAFFSRRRNKECLESRRERWMGLQ